MPKGFIHATLDLTLPVMRDRFLLKLAGDYAQGAHCEVALNDREYAIVAGLIEAGVIDGECEEPSDDDIVDIFMGMMQTYEPALLARLGLAEDAWDA